MEIGRLEFADQAPQVCLGQAPSHRAQLPQAQHRRPQLRLEVDRRRRWGGSPPTATSAQHAGCNPERGASAVHASPQGIHQGMDVSIWCRRHSRRLRNSVSSQRTPHTRCRSVRGASSMAARSVLESSCRLQPCWCPLRRHGQLHAPPDGLSSDASAVLHSARALSCVSAAA